MRQYNEFVRGIEEEHESKSGKIARKAGIIANRLETHSDKEAIPDRL